MVDEFDIPVPIDRARDMLRQKFRANAHIKDTRVIDMLVVKVRYHDEGITMSIANITVLILLCPSEWLHFYLCLI